MTSAKPPAGIVLIAHEVLAQITQNEMLAALSPQYRSLPREVVHLRTVKANLSELAGYDWSSSRRRQADEVRDQLLPIINANPTWRIQYFGAAPIPLAMHLGFLVGGWASVDVYQQRHDTNTWGWISEARSNNTQFNELALPNERIDMKGDVIIRISISHRVDGADTKSVIPESVGEFDIALRLPHEDALESVSDLEALKQEFDKVIDAVHATRPNAELHVFAAITVGAAFRLGMAINPTIHSAVHTYQYSKNSSPRYEHAFIIQREEPSTTQFSAEEIARANDVRAQYGEELQRLKDFAVTLQLRATDGLAQSWLRTVLPDADDSLSHGPILKLPTIFETELVRSSVDPLTTEIRDSFRYDDPGRMWQFDSRFLAQIASRMADERTARQAGRLLLLHEAVHLKAHGLTEATAGQMRRFPKILEELDYQADVWAFVHDYALGQGGIAASNNEPRAEFIRIVLVALDTFWAFDAGSDERRIEIRRLNRYLIWYWQLLRIERCSTLSEILTVLGSRPYIEIAGPRVESSGNRVFFSLDPARFDEPELALLYRQRIIRIGHGPGSRIKDILLGFRARDKEEIRNSLKSISDQIVD